MTTEHKIEEFLRERRGALNIGFTAKTRPKLLKKDKAGRLCPFAEVEKVSSVQGQIGVDYEHSCRKEQVRRGDEASYESGSCWGQHENATLIDRQGKKYMQVKINQSHGRYYVRGYKVPSNRIAPFLPARKPSLVKIARYALSNIVELHCGGVKIGEVKP